MPTAYHQRLWALGVGLVVFGLGAAPAVGADPVPTVTSEGVAALVAGKPGNVVVVNFWATWCPPCLREFPDLKSIHRDYHERGVDIVAISMNADDELEDIEKFVESFAPPFAIYRAASTDAAFLNGVLDTWYGEMPMTLIFDRNGSLARTHKKPLTYAELAADVDALLR